MAFRAVKMKMNKDFLVIGSGRVVQVILSLISMRMLTQLMSTYEVGSTYLVLSMIGYFSLVFINPLGMYINRHIHEWHQEKTLNSRLLEINRYFLFVLFLILIFSAFGYYVLGSGQGFQFWQILLIVSMVIYFGTWVQTLIPALNFFGKRLEFVALTTFNQVLVLTFSLVLCFCYGFSAFFWLLGQGVAALVMSFISLYFWLKLMPSPDVRLVEPSKSVFSSATWLFVWPIGLSTLFMWFQSQGYRIVLEKTIGLELVAQLGVGLGVAASIASVIESIFTQYYQPRFYQAASLGGIQERKAAFNQYFEKGILWYLAVMLIVAGSSRILLKLLVAPQFHNIFIFVVFGSIIEFFRMTNNLIYIGFHGEKLTKAPLISYFVASMVVGVGVFYGGSLGVEPVWVLVVASVVSFLSMIVQARRVLDFKIQVLPIIWKVLLPVGSLSVLVYLLSAAYFKN